MCRVGLFLIEVDRHEPSRSLTLPGRQTVRSTRGPRGRLAVALVRGSNSSSAAATTIKAPWRLCGWRCEVDEGRRRSARS